MTQLQAQLKALEVTHDVKAKARLLEATYQLLNDLNTQILTMSNEYQQKRLQQQMLEAEKRLKKHTIKMERPER